MSKRTLILGASDNPSRYSNKAMRALRKNDVPVVAIGKRVCEYDGIPILKGKPDDLDDIHTVAMYLNPDNQKGYYDYILSLNPKRIIFNPGTRNPEFSEMASAQGIETMDDCVLVMLGNNRF